MIVNHRIKYKFKYIVHVKKVNVQYFRKHSQLNITQDEHHTFRQNVVLTFIKAAGKCSSVILRAFVCLIQSKPDGLQWQEEESDLFHVFDLIRRFSLFSSPFLRTKPNQLRPKSLKRRRSKLFISVGSESCFYTYKEYLRVSSSSMMAAWFPQR